MGKDELLDQVIRYLQGLKNNPTVKIDIVPPHIEEIGESISGVVYGKEICRIEIEADTLYRKNKYDVFGNWKG